MLDFLRILKYVRICKKRRRRRRYLQDSGQTTCSWNGV